MCDVFKHFYFSTFLTTFYNFFFLLTFFTSVVIVDGAGSRLHYAKAVRLGCRDVSQMAPPVADIVLQELAELYLRRLNVQR